MDAPVRVREQRTHEDAHLELGARRAVLERHERDVERVARVLCGNLREAFRDGSAQHPSVRRVPCVLARSTCVDRKSRGSRNRCGCEDQRNDHDAREHGFASSTKDAEP